MEMTMESSGETKRIPIREGLFTSPLSPREKVRLLGSQCRKCGEVGLGDLKVCANCGGKELDCFPLTAEGKLWSYTVIRHRPPENYKGPDPFVPFGLGLVELPEGIRVLSPLDVDLEAIKVGMDLSLDVYPFYTDESSNEVMAFRFRPTQEASR